METELITTVDPELLARLDVILGQLESTNYYVSVILVAVLLTLAFAVALLVVTFLFRAFKQFM